MGPLWPFWNGFNKYPQGIWTFKFSPFGFTHYSLRLTMLILCIHLCIANQQQPLLTYEKPLLTTGVCFL